MNKIVVIGVGNAGNQISLLSELNGIPSLAINSSKRDLETLKVDGKNVVATVEIGDGLGTGKNRDEAKKFVKSVYDEQILSVLKTLITDDVDYVFVVSSTGGGTGSGISPMLSALIRNSFTKPEVIPVGITPSLKESAAAQQNSLDYQTEIARTSNAYMLFDNGHYHDRPVTEAIEAVNFDIIDAFLVVRGDYSKHAKYLSIDEKDMSRILSSKGRVLIGLVKDVTEKNIDGDLEQYVINSIKAQSHVELQGEESIMSRGMIYHVSEKIHGGINSDLPKISSEFGNIIEGFEHVSYTDEKGHVAVILSGLSFPDDHVEKVMEVIERYDSITSDVGSRLLGTQESNINDIRRKEEKQESTSSKDIFDMF